MKNITDELKKLDADVRKKAQELNVSLMLQGENIQQQIGKQVDIRMRNGQTVKGRLKSIWYIFDTTQREYSGLVRDAYPVFIIETWKPFCRQLKLSDIETFSVQD
jgi:hypothetical protein